MAVMAVNFFEFTDLVGLVLTTVGLLIMRKVYPKKHRTLQNIQLDKMEVLEAF